MRLQISLSRWWNLHTLDQYLKFPSFKKNRRSMTWVIYLLFLLFYIRTYFEFWLVSYILHAKILNKKSYLELFTACISIFTQCILCVLHSFSDCKLILLLYFCSPFKDSLVLWNFLFSFSHVCTYFRDVVNENTIMWT